MRLGDRQLSDDNGILETVKHFVQKEIDPIASKIDDRMHIPPSIFQKMSSLNLFGMLAPESVGGVAMPFSSFLKVIQEFSRCSPSLALVLATHNSLALILMDRFGGGRQKDVFLRDMAEGKKIGSVSVGNAGSFLNTDDLDIRATKSSSDFYIVTGSNSIILNGSYGSIFLVLCRYDEGRIALAILEDRDALEVKPRNLLGLKGGGISSLRVYEHRVSAENLLGTSSHDSDIVKVAQENFWLCMSAISIGISRASIDLGVRYANHRIQFGKPIAEFEAIQDLVGEMVMGYTSSTSMLNDLGRRKDSGDDVTMDAAIARMLSSNTAQTCSKSALKIHGGYGFIKDFPVERFVRDAETIRLLGDRYHDLLRIAGKGFLHAL